MAFEITQNSLELFIEPPLSDIDIERRPEGKMVVDFARWVSSEVHITAKQPTTEQKNTPNGVVLSVS